MDGEKVEKEVSSEKRTLKNAILARYVMGEKIGIAKEKN